MCSYWGTSVSLRKEGLMLVTAGYLQQKHLQPPTIDEEFLCTSSITASSVIDKCFYKCFYNRVASGAKLLCVQ